MGSVITSDDILGKEVVDPNGTILGVISKLHISQERKEIIGITIDQGFMRPDLFYGIKHVKFFGVDTVFVDIISVDTYVGMDVFTQEGKKIGKVKDLVTKHNKIETIIVHRSKLLSSDLHVPFTAVKSIEHSVIIKKGLFS